MSKIKVDQIESSDVNVKLAPKGTNAVQIKGAGSDDAAVKLSSASGAHGVKIKSPNHSASQSHTLVLPDNNIETDKFLKVKSVTNAGNQAVGQLEFASIASPDLNNIDGSHFTSGTMPSARFPSAFNASSGGGLKLVSTTTVSGSSVTSIGFTFEPNSIYKIHGRKIITTGNPNRFTLYFTRSGAEVSISNSSRYLIFYDHDLNSTELRYGTYAHLSSNSPLKLGQYSSKFAWSIGVSTYPLSGHVDWWCINTLYSDSDDFALSEGFARISNNALGAPINGIYITSDSGNFDVGTTVDLYKYGET